MSVRVEPLQVKGIKEALAELNTIDKRLRRQMGQEYKTIVKPMVSEAKHLVPFNAPLSGWTRSWTPRGIKTRGAGNELLPWLENQQRTVKPYLSGKKPKLTQHGMKNLAAFGIRWDSATAVLFDMSAEPKTPQGAQMIAALNSRFGFASRAMWEAYERRFPDVEREIRQLVEKIMDAVDRKIKVVP